MYILSGHPLSLTYIDAIVWVMSCSSLLCDVTLMPDVVKISDDILSEGFDGKCYVELGRNRDNEISALNYLCFFHSI